MINLAIYDLIIVHNFFTENYRATIGVDFALKVINWDAQTVVRLQLWDIAGKTTPGKTILNSLTLKCCITSTKENALKLTRIIPEISIISEL